MREMLKQVQHDTFLSAVRTLMNLHLRQENAHAAFKFCRMPYYLPPGTLPLQQFLRQAIGTPVLE